MFARTLTSTLLRFAKFPVVALLGPRQSGKTTLAKTTFPNHHFLTLEDLELRSFAEEDPKRFLQTYDNPHGIILDEFQHVPKLLSYIQVAVDAQKRPGYFILTGSQNFLMNAAITQSLAGRVGVVTLLPLSLSELKKNQLLDAHSLDQILFQGGYPRLYAEKFSSLEFYPSYIYTYVERDVRQLAHVADLTLFQKFMKLCAARVGQLLNIADLSIQCGVDRRTVQKWLSLLEASYILFFLKPYFNNFSKRVVKTAKLYFCDTGLACSLLEIRSASDLALSSFRGSLFESFIIADLYKQYYNAGRNPSLYFWRDQNGQVEIDCLLDRGIELIPMEIKSGATLSSSFFDPLDRWNHLSPTDPSKRYLLYGGREVQSRSRGQVVGWEAAGDLISQLDAIH